MSSRPRPQTPIIAAAKDSRPKWPYRHGEHGSNLGYIDKTEIGWIKNDDRSNGLSPHGDGDFVRPWGSIAFRRRDNCGCRVPAASSPVNVENAPT